MQLVRDLSEAQLNNPSVVTVGSYDGVHLGHQYLIKRMTQAAKTQGYSTVVVTFFPRPQAVLAPHLPSRYLTMPEERADLLRQLGVDVTAILPFTRQVAQLSAQQFVRDMTTQLKMSELWVGPDFALGRHRQGDIPSLRQMGLDMGFSLNVIQPLQQNGDVISSTRIRALLEVGDVRAAAALLGRYPAVVGVVSSGDQRGRRLGFPTANIVLSDDMVMPARGVYACFIHHTGRRWMAATNIGRRPTFDNSEANIVEAFLLHFDGNLYDSKLKIELVDFLRPERRFDSVESLVAQITQDTQKAEEILASVQRHPTTQ